MARDHEDDRLSDERSSRPGRRDDDDRLSDERSPRRDRDDYDEDEEPLPKMRGKSGLGKLSQEARMKEIKTAGIVLIVAGILQMISGGIELATAEQQLRAANIPVHLHPRVMQFVYIIVAGVVLLGLTFVIFGAVIKSAPLPISITALVLFIGFHGILAVLAPETIVGGLIIKIIVLVSLFKAIQAALAYAKADNQPDDY
jgi:hypothetical protein